MSKKKILFSISYYTPYVSGLTICAQRVAENLVIDNQVEILCMRHDTNLLEHENNIWRANPLFRIGKGFISFDWVIKSWKLVRDVDVVVINLPQFEGFITAILAWIFIKKIVAIVHCEVTMKNKLIQLILDKANILSMMLSNNIVVYTMDYAENSRWIKYFRNKLVEIYPPVI